MRTQRSLIDYSLAKRATLADLFAGRIAPGDACDAHPYLLRAAKHHGVVSTRTCPVCRGSDPLVDVTYVFGDELKDSSGHARDAAEMAALAERYDELTVHVVEVCRRCGWNHLDSTYLIGRAGLPPARRRRSANP